MEFFEGLKYSLLPSLLLWVILFLLIRLIWAIL